MGLHVASPPNTGFHPFHAGHGLSIFSEQRKKSGDRSRTSKRIAAASATSAACRHLPQRIANDRKPGGEPMANIEWLHDYDDGLQRAVNENKPWKI